jgi:two-component system sensor histidine kinase PilS (NtrC family)
MTQLARNLRWLIGIRLVVITSVVVPYFLLQLSERTTAPRLDFLYLLAGFTYLASLIYIALLRLLDEQLMAQAYFQFVGDLLLITGLVWYFGGVASPFSMLYLIVISVAASILRRRAGILVATLAYGFYAGLLLALYSHWLPPAEPARFEEPTVWRLTYNLAIHLFGFYAVALLTDYLAQNVSQAEKELEEKRENLADLQVVHRDVIESITSGLITTDRRGTVTSANRAAEEILCLSGDALIGGPVERTGMFTADAWQAYAEDCARRGRARGEIEFRRGEQELFAGFSISRLTDAEGKHRGFIVVFQDLTEVRKLQEEVRLKEGMAAVGELAAGIAHEIGNPLAAISGSVQMLVSSPADPARGKLLEIVLKESQRLDRTIKGFLQFARPKERSAVRFDIARLLQENVELLRNSEEVGPSHRIEISLEPPSAQLVADPDQVSQIFWNLARNGLRAMPRGGTLRVTGQLADGLYRLVVADTGRGMTAEARAKLFQPFKSFFDGGTGIGMAIVYRIVQMHGGRLQVDTEPEGGTRVSVELPRAEAPAAPGPGASGPAAPPVAVRA